MLRLSTLRLSRVPKRQQIITLRWRTDEEKGNIDRNMLQPASQGKPTQLPKLLGRKRHASLDPTKQRKQHVSYLDDDDGFYDESDDVPSTEDVPSYPVLRDLLASGTATPESVLRARFGNDEYYAPELLQADAYWNEEDYDQHIQPQGLSAEDIERMTFKDDEGNEVLHLPYTAEDFQEQYLGMFEEPEYDGPEGFQEIVSEMDARQEEDFAKRNPEDFFYYEQDDLMTITGMDKSDFRNETIDETVLPLNLEEDSIAGFMTAVQEHPTAVASITDEAPHPQSLREPVPHFRKQPPAEFVHAHQRFLFVSGLPLSAHHSDLENPVHRQALQERVAQLVGNVDSSSVAVTEPDCAFVGFPSPRAVWQALQGPKDAVLQVPVEASMPTDLEHPFVKAADADTVIELQNIPVGSTAKSLLNTLFPLNTEVYTAYGEGLTTDSVCFLTKHSCLLRFSSAEQAQSALDSHIFEDRLSALGRHVVHFFRARRENRIINKDLKRRLGDRIMVDCDVPTPKFFRSHAAVVRIERLEKTATKAELTAQFQPFCSAFRDEQGSIEFVKDHAGKFMGEAYIGFDAPGEAERARKSLNGSRTMRKVKDVKVPNRPDIAPPEPRLERSEAELLDDLNNWERFVDAADLEKIYATGVKKIVLDETLRNLRYKNVTFGPFDQAVRSEALHPETQSGDMYKEVVQDYISTLIECLPTRENPGLLYEALHLPEEEVDLGVFEAEEERQIEIERKRANPKL